MKKIIILVLVALLLSGCGQVTSNKEKITENPSEKTSEVFTEGESASRPLYWELRPSVPIYGVNLNDYSKEQQEKLLEIGWIKGESEYCTEYVYKFHMILGDVSDIDHKLTVEEAKKIIEKYSEQGFEKITEEFFKIQPYPDRVFGSGIKRMFFYSENSYDNSIEHICIVNNSIISLRIDGENRIETLLYPIEE